MFVFVRHFFRQKTGPSTILPVFVFIIITTYLMLCMVCYKVLWMNEWTTSGAHYRRSIMRSWLHPLYFLWCPKLNRSLPLCSTLKVKIVLCTNCNILSLTIVYSLQLLCDHGLCVANCDGDGAKYASLSWNWYTLCVNWPHLSLLCSFPWRW